MLNPHPKDLAGLLGAAERYRKAKEAHHEAFLTYPAGSDPTQLNAAACEEREAQAALLRAALEKRS